MPNLKVHLSGDRPFWLGLVLLLALALGHSLWATSLDGFTIDEPYHIAAGASYVRWGDFRLNPEHPPLVKLIAGLAVPPDVLHLLPLQLLSEKTQERDYTQKAVFLYSDSARVHRRARAALLLFNTLLLAALAVVLWRVFGGGHAGSGIALAALLLLALDPTVSAHLPVVMTDLPMALLGTISLGLSILALRDRSTSDWLLLGVATGLLLATKHSAPLIVLPLLLGCLAVFGWQAAHKQFSGRPALGLVAACALSMVVLWGAYGFRYHETPGTTAETFNRPLAAKITDLHSPLLRRALTAAQTLHLVPRAYLWGLADTLRAGVEGRPSWIQALGRSYQGKAPWWIPFADLVVKLPPAFLLLAMYGTVLLLAGRLAREIALPLAGFVAMAVSFMLFIAHNGIFYAGLRHWLFVVPLLAVSGAVGAWSLLQSASLGRRAVTIAALLWIGITVLPQRRIWEYHNLFAGGSENAWRSFDNESVDLGQRTTELVAFYKGHIAPAPIMVDYWAFHQQLQAEHVKPWEPQPEEIGNGDFTGWLCFRAPDIALRDWHDMPTLRNVEPTARFGSLLLYHGTFHLPRVAAGILEFRALQILTDQKIIEQYLLKSIALDPETAPVAIELGNFALGRRENQQALRWYELARKDAATDPDILRDVEQQIQRVVSAPAGTLVPALRNPSKE